MKQPHSLTREILSDANVEHLRSETLTAMLKVTRRRRSMRRAGVVAGVAGLVALAAWVGQQQRAQGPLASISSPIQESSPETKPISEAELLGLFPGQTVALIGSPGDQRFIVFGGRR